MGGAEGDVDDERVVAVLVDGLGSERRVFPIDEGVARAINEGAVASFNRFCSLALREQIIMARLYRARERVLRVVRREPRGSVGGSDAADFGTSNQITVASLGPVGR